jgi:hypothetical protein
MTGFAIAEFGPLVTTVDVDEAVIATLQEWLPTYLDQIEIERELGAGYLPRPKLEAYANTLDSAEFLDHTLPAVIVTTAATANPPEITNDFSYITNWKMTVSCILRGRGTRPAEARRNAALFEGSVRRLLIQQGAIEAIQSKRCRWMSSNVAPLPDATGKGRYLAAGISQWVVFGDVAASWSGGGPLIPNATPYSDLAEVVQVSTDVEGTTSITED